MSIYGFWQGPTYRPSTRDELFGAALDQPMSLGATFWDQAKGGVLESFGLGTAIRTLSLPPAAQKNRARGESIEAYEARQERVKGITEDEYKASPYYRDSVPWDSAMTEDRAAALATMYDAKRVREYFAEKRPITAFFGNLAGQATDPINYIPVAGPTVKAAAVARMGVVKGIAATAALDAAANTAIAGIATRETRRGFGDDVSWQMMVSEIATAALLGTAFGTVGGVLQRRADIRADALRSEAEVKVNTLRSTQEARIALNEAIGGLANDGEVRLSPNGIAPIERIAQETASPRQDRFGFEAFRSDMVSISRIENDSKLSKLEADREQILSGGSLSETPSGTDYSLGSRASIEEVISRIDAKREEIASAPPPEIGSAADRIVYEKWKREKESEALSDMFLGGKTISYTAPDGRTIFATRVRGGADTGVGGVQLREGSPDGRILADPAMGEAGLRQFIEGLEFQKTNPRAVGASPARPEPPPQGRAEAEAKVAKPENYKALADQYRVDPEAGTFPEEAELRQLAQAGRLSEEDMAVLDDADTAFQDGVSYGEALRSVVGCLV